MQGRFRGRKGGKTQNMLGAVDFDMKFTYVLAGWEGSSHDSKVLQDALKRGFKVSKGKYYLADAGYGERKGCMPPYRRIRYYLKEYTNNPLENELYLFKDNIFSDYVFSVISSDAVNKAFADSPIEVADNTSESSGAT
ncbi:uncharacterized protein LOC110726959 [Chenopodium quinoa]|uniref:uncharacterized protein LOC110726959 n=1 Tax=Chenopodium quinoa TaxID=63459 RepID=UPI000B79205F|nr:uncharacterized protein LOC110726959 [Chenopodium quinoa]